MKYWRGLIRPSVFFETKVRQPVPPEYCQQHLLFGNGVKAQYRDTILPEQFIYQDFGFWKRVSMLLVCSMGFTKLPKLESGMSRTL